ncbi:MAG: class I SAM-dependent methyltransferase [Actinomycetota bacterium]
MDDVGEFNRGRWDELVAAGCEYTRPWWHLDSATAKTRVDPENQLDDLAGASVLCLAAGGGQQSVAFGLLGCDVTVLDASDAQLERDRAIAERYGLAPRLIRGDMRDLSMLADGSIDVVWQAHSINFVPDPHPVFAEVARVLRPGGRYRLQFTNPFIHGTWDRRSDGHYLLAGPYVDGEVVRTSPWHVDDGAGAVTTVEGPREFKHTLSTVLNGVTAVGLEIAGFWEDVEGDADAEAGSWPHFKRYGAPWLTVWSRRA